MFRSIPVVMLAAVLLVAACGAQPIGPPTTPPTPSTPVATPTPTPVASPSVAPSPTTAPPATPSTAPVVLTPDERYLLDGIRRGAIDCEPIRASADLPPGAIAGIECASDEPSVARIGFYRFATDQAMLDAYLARMRAEGVELESGGCFDGEGEGAYIPHEGFSIDRDGCFVNAEGYANYRATRSGSHVYIGILGRTGDMRALEDFAWRFNQDTPGQPTLWSEPES